MVPRHQLVTLLYLIIHGIRLILINANRFNQTASNLMLLVSAAYLVCMVYFLIKARGQKTSQSMEILIYILFANLVLSQGLL